MSRLNQTRKALEALFDLAHLRQAVLDYSEGIVRMANREEDEAEALRLFSSVGYATEKAEYGRMLP